MICEHDTYFPVGKDANPDSVNKKLGRYVKDLETDLRNVNLNSNFNEFCYTLSL
jgi:hypothetical protein